MGFQITKLLINSVIDELIRGFENGIKEDFPAELLKE